MRTKLALSALIAASLLGATAISSAQTQNQPASGASSSGNVGPGAADGAPRQGTGTSTGGAMQNNNMGATGGGMQNNSMGMQNNGMGGGTTGASGRPDASQQGAPTGAAVNSRGDSTEPGNVKAGATR